MDTKITDQIWSNADFDRADPQGKLAAIWLLTNKSLNLLGYADLNERHFVFETQLPPEALAKGFEALGKGLVQVHKGYWLRNYIGLQIGRGLSLGRNNFGKGVCRMLASGCNEVLGRLVLSEYPELLSVEGFISPWKGSGASVKHRRGEEKRGEEKRGEDLGLDSARAETKAEARPETVEQVQAYGAEIGLSANEAAAFFDHFTANGWRQGGRAVMRDWRAALRNWQRRSGEFAASGRAPKNFQVAAAGLKFDPTKPHAHTGGIPVYES